MKKNENIKKFFSKVVVSIARKTAEIESNSACALFSYQENETEQVKKLRKF